MNFAIIDLETLRTTVGGQAAGAQAAPSSDARVREIIREEMEQQRRADESDRAYEWERRHPLGRFICQGDRECMRNY